MPSKDPDAKLDYAIDWSAWLREGDTIASAEWTVPAGITKSTSPAASVTGSRAVVWLEGGTHGVDYNLVCRITTAQGRVADATLPIRVRNR